MITLDLDEAPSVVTAGVPLFSDALASFRPESANQTFPLMRAIRFDGEIGQ